ncbi:MAG: radical SAM protein, partial [Deltaproteobacteria bacterium]|nr:radical SAM protein [Deltaproteobacteria bacterium]
MEGNSPIDERSDGQCTPLRTLYFYLTHGCNLHCRHCWIVPKFDPEGRPEPSLDFELFQWIVTQAKPLGLTGVKLTGGEPLIHPNIREILDYVREQNLGLTVETNGTRCTPELAEMMRAC